MTISGKLQPGQSGSDLLAELDKVFIAPLVTPKIARFTYIRQASGDHFFMNLAVEPMDETTASAFEQYVSLCEKGGFNGEQVSFKKVEKISEEADFLAGHYDPKQEDDPFVQNFSLSRSFEFRSLSEWEQFTDAYGFALLSKDHARFESYLAAFIGDPSDLAKARQAMTSDDMVAIDPHVTLTLEDQSIVGPEFDKTAFLPFRFFRNCFWPDYENGSCER